MLSALHASEMNLWPGHRRPFRPSRFSESGSTLLATLAILVITLIVVGAALTEALNRFRVSHQSLQWAQAGQAAEAGVEAALTSAQKDSWIVDGWSGLPGPPGAAAVTRLFTLSANVPDVGEITARVSVDQVAIGGANWLRIRSTGKADLTGDAFISLDASDALLRKLSLRHDRTDGTDVGANPRATRTVEILAAPIPKGLVSMPILLDQKLTMKGGWVDSFDSSNPAKSTNGSYDIAKRQSKGNVGINDTQGTSDLGGAYIYGDLSYSGASPAGTNNVQGLVSKPFNADIATVKDPVWTNYNLTPSAINKSATLIGGTKSSPARYKVSELTVSGGQQLTLSPKATGVESYIEVWVTGNFTTSGSGYVLEEAGVHATFYVAGDLTVSGSAFTVKSNVAANNIINLITPPSGSQQKVTVSGSGVFVGVINGPGADFTLSGNASFSGALIGKTMNISGGANVHYDEALNRNGTASGNHYQFRSWVEAVR